VFRSRPRPVMIQVPGKNINDKIRKYQEPAINENNAAVFIITMNDIMEEK
jgi:hypothetical protein